MTQSSASALTFEQSPAACVWRGYDQLGCPRGGDAALDEAERAGGNQEPDSWSSPIDEAFVDPRADAA